MKIKNKQEKMTTIADRDTQLVKEVDAGVKNQWKFEWLEKTTDIKQGGNKNKRPNW